MDFIGHWSERTQIGALQLVAWIGLSRSKFYFWRDRYGQANEHNALVPRDHWLEPWEKVAIIDFHHQFSLEGYRRLTFMMLDRDVVAVSPSSTYRVLKAAGLLQRWKPKASHKGKGFQQHASAPRALACRYLLSEHYGDLLLSVLGPGWLF